MATYTESQESCESTAETKIPCGSKRSLDAGKEQIFSAVNDVIGKNSKWTVDQQDRLQRRFREVYETALHENIEFDGHTWAEKEAHEDAETTQEFEPVNLERQNHVNNMAVNLDTLIVDTTSKRKHCPQKITKQAALKLQSQHVALENHKPVVPSTISDCTSEHIVNTEDAASVTDHLTSAGKTVSSLTKALPVMENKAQRVINATEMQNATTRTTTHHIVTKPHPQEDKMASSMTPLKRRLDETPSNSLDDKISKGQMPKRVLRNHPIKKYKLRNSTPS